MTTSSRNPVTAAPGATWSQRAASELLPGLVSPFTWSIWSHAAQRALRAHYETHGHELPAAPTFWRLYLGRAYLDLQALSDADAAISSAKSPAVGQRLFARGAGRRQADLVTQTLARVSENLPAIERWQERVHGTEWRQATILQVMEEIEPRAEAALSLYYQVSSALAASRFRLTRWLQDWLPQEDSSLLSELFAGLDQDIGAMDHRHRLGQLGVEGGYEAQGVVGPPHEVLDRFLVDYGHWATRPLEAAEPRWREEPERLLAAARKWREIPASFADLEDRRLQAAGLVSQSLNLLRRRQFEPSFRQLQQLVDVLPGCRNALVLAMATARFWALGAAREAMADGRLLAVEDVFLLELEELKQMMTGEWSNVEQVRPLVEERRHQYEIWYGIEAPDLLR